MKHYWKGPLNFPADAGELTFEKVKYDKESSTILILPEDAVVEDPEQAEHLITGLDSQWLLVNGMQGNRNPVRILSSKLNESSTAYIVEDTNELIKVKRFDVNSNIHSISTSYKRPTY